jgi:DME family drug/metabolite transporter
MPAEQVADGPARAAWFGITQVATAGLLWGTIGVGVKLVQRHSALSVITIGGYRIAIAAVLLAVVVVATRRTAAARLIVAEHAPRVIAVGVITGAFQLLYFAGVVTANVSIATVISLGFAPLLVTILTAVRDRVWPSRHHMASVAVAVAGLVLVSAGSGSTSGPHPVIGVLAATGSGACYGIATLLAEPLTKTFDPISVTAVTTPFGALALVPLAVVVGLVSHHSLATGNSEAISLLVYLGAITTAVGYAFLYAGLRTTPSGVAVVATLIEPVAAAILAVLILSEQLSAVSVTGGVLILAAIASLGFAPTTPAVV